MGSSKAEYIQEKEDLNRSNILELTSILRKIQISDSIAEDYLPLKDYMKSQGKVKKLSKYLNSIEKSDGSSETDILSKDELLQVSAKIDKYLESINKNIPFENRYQNPLKIVSSDASKDDIIIYTSTSYDEDFSDDNTTSTSTQNDPKSLNNIEYDLLQYYTAGKVRDKERQLIFVNRMGDSFFMRALAFLDLLENLGIQRLVKKYNKKKEGYIGGEVVGQVNLLNGAYQFLLGFGPQNQLITSETKLQVHYYNFPKQRVDLYVHLLHAELEEDKKFLELLSEADHNTNRRFQIDLQKCFKEQNKTS